MDKLLFTPGPTTLPYEVLKALSNQVISHRCEDYYKLFDDFSQKLKKVFQTDNPVITFPGAGSGGLEAGIVNFFSPEDKVLLFSVGEFGERFGKIAETFGLDLIKYEFPYGKSVDKEVATRAFEEHHDAKGILITHNETSTGVTNNLEELSKIFESREGLLIVDCISSLGGIPVMTDLLNIDVAITGSQKALMSPPGLTFLSISPKALDFMEKANCPRYYWDIKEALESLKKRQNPYTPAVNLIAASSTALDLILNEGMENVFERHVRMADLFRSGAVKLGFKLFAQENYSSTVTALLPPENFSAEKIQEVLLRNYNIYSVGGQGALKGKILRFGHMGKTQIKDINYLLNSLEEIIKG
jgi:aspartate aminotransferase-like enzyme